MNSTKKFLGALLLLAIFSCSEKKEQIVEEEQISEVDSIQDNLAKEAVFEWITELCTNEGTYDAKKYTENELRDTYKLWWEMSGYLNANALVRNREDIGNLSLEKLDKEYHEKLQKFKSLNLVKESYWETLRNNKIREMNESYELKKIAIQSHIRPELLKENRFAKECQEYAIALSSMNDELLLETWRKLVQKQAEKNGAPDLLLQRFDQENASADRLIYARNQVMTYGWWNCANHVIYHFEDDGTPAKEFEKLFSNVKSECDEP